MFIIIYRRRPNEDATKRLLEAYPRPGNIDNLQVPRTNPEVWDELRPQHRVLDGHMQRSQGLLSSALSASINMLDQIGNGVGGELENHLPEISDIIRALSAAFSNLNQARKDNVRIDLAFPTSLICSWDTPVGTKLLFDGDAKKLVHDHPNRQGGKLRKKIFK